MFLLCTSEYAASYQIPKNASTKRKASHCPDCLITWFNCQMNVCSGKEMLIIWTRYYYFTFHALHRMFSDYGNLQQSDREPHRIHLSWLKIYAFEVYEKCHWTHYVSSSNLMHISSNINKAKVQGGKAILLHVKLQKNQVQRKKLFK